MREITERDLSAAAVRRPEDATAAGRQGATGGEWESAMPKESKKGAGTPAGRLSDRQRRRAESFARCCEGAVTGAGRGEW